MAYGSFGAGFSQTFNPQIVGQAIASTYGAYKQGQAEDKATATRDAAIKQLEDEYAAGQGKGLESAIPQKVQPSSGADNGVDAVSGAAPKQYQPMTRETYALKKQAINDAYDNDMNMAKAVFLRNSGQWDKAEAMEKQVKQDRFRQGMVNFYGRVKNGDPEALKEFSGYLNMTMGDGQQISVNNDGTMSVTVNGKVVNPNFRPSMAQINAAFTNYANNAQFFYDNDFNGFLDRNLSIGKAALDREKFAETKRATGVQEGLQRADLELKNQKFKADEAQRGVTNAQKNRELDLVEKKTKADIKNNEDKRALELQKYLSGQELERLKIADQQERTAILKAASDREAQADAEKHELTYVTDPTTGKKTLEDPITHQTLGEPVDGQLVIAGYTPQQVNKMVQEAAKAGVEMITDYYPDPKTGRDRPRYIFKVGNKATSTLEEAIALKNQSEKSAINPAATVATGKNAGSTVGAAGLKDENGNPAKPPKRKRTKIEMEDDARMERIKKAAKGAKKAAKAFNYDNVGER